MTGKVVVFANLKARKMAGHQSFGMLLAASDGEGTIELLRPPPFAENGVRIGLEGMENNEAY